MPELPEVETIRRGLEKNLLDKKILSVDVSAKSPVRGDKKKFLATLAGNSFKKINRLGKLLVFELADKNFLLVHLKMTGQLIYVGDKIIAGGHNLPRLSETKLPGQFTRLTINFADHSKLYFNDMRRFGYFKIADAAEIKKIRAQFGTDPLSKEFTLGNFKAALGRRKKSPIKAVLMDQKLIAGIGNIYADETCFAAKVLPGRRVAALSEKEIKELHKAAPKVLEKALDFGGTTFRNYADSNGEKGKFREFLKVYGRAGQLCLRCKRGIIKKMRIAGRGTSYCAVCQK